MWVDVHVFWERKRWPDDLGVVLDIPGPVVLVLNRTDLILCLVFLSIIYRI
jgi:hypothetical protein